MKGDKRKRKLAIITRHFPPDTFGGSEEVIYNIWKRAKEKYEVILITGWSNSHDHLPSPSYGMRLRGSCRLFDYARFYFFCRGILKKERPDLVLVNIFEIPLKGIPSISLLHDLSYRDVSGRDNEFKKLNAKRRLNRADKIIVVSNRTKEYVKRLGINSDKINVIYNGIDHERFKPAAKNGGKFTITYPARMTEIKGQHVAIEALRMLQPELLNKIELILVGFAGDRRYLLRLKRMGENLPVKIHTNVSRIEKYYQEADVVIFPTFMEEGFGFTALEAMACAKPVIHSDIPAVRETTGDMGIKVPPGDAKALASQVTRLFSDKKLREELADKGAEYVRSHYDWDKTFREYDRTFEELLER